MTSTIWCSIFLRVAAGDLMRQRSLWTSLMSFCLSSSLPFISLFMMKCPCRFALISSTRCMAFTVFCQSSLLYLTGTLRRFSNSKAGSTVSSLPAALRKALVQRVLRGFLFFLNSLWHLDRQNLKILQSFRTN
uniref:Putative secreted protein n=1 Tax=Ixodes ricinus TaxID=34613 RepID=A0A6B0URF5_IXORI